MNVTGNSVGIDYHDSQVQVSVLASDGAQLGNRSLSNDTTAVIKYISTFGEVKEVAIEACNGAAAFADELACRSDYRIRLAHPGFVSRMKRGLDKTDYADARVLGDLVRVGYLPEVWLAPENVRDLRDLVRYRETCVCQRRNVKLRIRGLLSNNRIRKPEKLSLWTQGGIRWLKGEIGLAVNAAWVMEKHLQEMLRIILEIKEVEKRLKEVSKGDPLIQRLLKEKGIGLVTACIMRAEIGRFDRFRNGKQFARFCGLTPCNSSSGKRQADAGVISAGNPLLKKALIQGAHSLMRYDQDCRTYVARLSSFGKPKPVIAVAVANRWMRRLFYRIVAEDYPMAA